MTKNYLKRRNFRGKQFREFWPKSRKFVHVKSIEMGYSRKFISAKFCYIAKVDSYKTVRLFCATEYHIYII